MGAKNYCKDKRDQEMRDYHFQYHAIQPANGKPYYIGGKKGKGRREVILKESLTIRNTYVINWKMSQNFQVVRLVRVIAIMMMNVNNRAEGVEIPVWVFLICLQIPEYVRNYQNVTSLNGMMVKIYYIHGQGASLALNQNLCSALPFSTAILEIVFML